MVREFGFEGAGGTGVRCPTPNVPDSPFAHPQSPQDGSTQPHPPRLQAPWHGRPHARRWQYPSQIRSQQDPLQQSTHGPHAGAQAGAQTGAQAAGPQAGAQAGAQTGPHGQQPATICGGTMAKAGTANPHTRTAAAINTSERMATLPYSRGSGGLSSRNRTPAGMTMGSGDLST